MNKRKAWAEITIDPPHEWQLPTFGSKIPFRYWAHVHFEKDSMWGQQAWTFIVDLNGMPDPKDGVIGATVSFMAPGAPEYLIEEGATFELVCGKIHFGRGVIKKLVA